ncbi:MAG: undecaprenyl/decaprenyl-phosphate alpha-N-acetylglucosaminyl 1-phosphate transferase [Bacteroidetes bacterium]|mgnify:CR=1 FL=1|nr:MAG: undecaprenyl/decaprenyl-phosphate alpha-N-acetylglucosaminyl 1-phosphate transferase [Bacteroidota bacterium]REK04911.1 MAG: undecaprenyl/decaprenyl-phosphate alpha-N-acetylglucosaminyl 1-phosphate transferase [Bacteroidota bacterium]REK32860.1 MAG: undecaprenyl/decaprenyl-phosphate alpha-N-acetylglucosaminyl 1-phosphate transferase [Bacteroidota bacterium]REK50951.1 MAG: undecaprenyl/decaprenyl-phosphate alpha-N-acetylglucosaminyl 1-phosphate transferase [Bacteroidota bacterium]
MHHLFFCFITAFVISLASIPSIIRIAKKVDAFDEPDERKFHKKRVPLLGGIAIFASTLFSFVFWAAAYIEPAHSFIIASLLILFFMGLRDDILPLSPYAKIFVQLVAVFLVTAFCGLKVDSLYGFFGVHELSEIYAGTLGILIILYIINSFNLIDGLDGLAAGLGLIASAFYALLFYHYRDFMMAYLALALCGSLAAFLIFNFQPARIFMGDTGSMIVGFILAVLSLRFLELSHADLPAMIFTYSYSPVVLFSALVIPLTDTFRIFIIRIFRKKSPFKPDRRHIHHKLLELGLSHAGSAILLYVVSMIYLFAAYFLRHQNPAMILFIFIFSALLLTQLPHLILKRRRQRQIA